MNLEVAPKSTDELVATPIVHQTAFWGRVHRRLGFETGAFDVSFRPAGVTERGDFLVLRAPLNDTHDYAYVPFGPEIGPDTESVGIFLEQLSRELRPLLGPRCAFVRWDLPWTAVHATDADRIAPDGSWDGPPPRQLRELRMNFGTSDHNLWKASRDVLPPDTLLIDLQTSDDTLLGRMHHKTRYNIRLAQRHGVVIEEGTSADLPEWYSVYLETTERAGLDPMPLAQVATMLDERAEDSASPVRCRLLLARHNGVLVAGMLLAIAPPRATYLYGASRREYRNLMAPYALQWAAIRLANANGCTEYDMFGTAPRNNSDHPLAGVHRFKIGFGGRLVHREGCWDYPFDENVYSAWRGFEESQVLKRTIAAR